MRKDVLNSHVSVITDSKSLNKMKGVKVNEVEVENLGIDPSASRMLSERSTI
jgi:hypothetical protein